MTTKYLAKFQSIDMIFGMRVYNHKLQINFEIRSGWMIFGQPTAVGLWNFANYLVFTTLNKMCRNDTNVPAVNIKETRKCFKVDL
jgi:hypothetical protein